MLQPKGIIPAMITPFTETYEIDEVALRQQVRRLISAKVDGLFGLGTNGEFFSLEFDEKVRIAEIIMEETQGKVPVYIGAGDATTWQTIKLARKLEEIGVDALTVITPYFLTFTQKELVDHFKRVAEATSLPIVLYNIPSRTGNHLQPGSAAELAKIPNIVGIKDSSGSYDTILQYIGLSNSDFVVLSGTDSLILSTLMAGGAGAVAATANVFPEVVVSIYELWSQGKWEEAQSQQKKLNALRNGFGLGTLPSVLKEAMNRLGFSAGPPRPPVAPLSKEAAAELARILDSYGDLSGSEGAK
jgi:4-hydroxy-tetrahydrodipicolinate synthase